MNGPWKCFCESERKTPGWLTDSLYKQDYEILNKTETQESPVCEKYTEESYKMKTMNESIKYIIIIINTILRMIIIAIIDKVGLDTQSKEMVFVTNAVFLATIFNTGFLLLIVNANL